MINSLKSRSSLKLRSLVCGLVVLAGSTFDPSEAWSKTEGTRRIEVSVSKAQRAQFKDLTQSLRMVLLTPIIDRNDEVIFLEVSEIKNPIISTGLKVKTGDRFSHVVISKKAKDGSRTSRRHSVLGPTASFTLYPELLEAESIEVDLRRGKIIVPMTYRLN